jgi:hypothetical protein
MQHVNQQGTTRRTMLRAGAAAGTAAALGAVGIFAAGTAGAATTAGSGNQGLPYPSGVTDMAARTRVRGQFQAQRYHTPALGRLPYGPGATLVHADGSRQGGGSEWAAAPAAAPWRRGHTCVQHPAAGNISRLTAFYDSSLLSYAAYQSRAGPAAEAPLS